jgi:hypothetical protein
MRKTNAKWGSQFWLPPAFSRRAPGREGSRAARKVGQTLWSARVPLDPLFALQNLLQTIPERPARGRAAAQGVRPTLRRGNPQSCLPHLLAAALAFAPIGCKPDHKVTVKETVEEVPSVAKLPIVVSMGDPKQDKQLVSGFYGIEANSWRWTAKDFTVSLRPPAGSAVQGATLDFALSIPGVVIEKLKSVTLSASINGTALAPETYAQDGQFDYKRDIPSNLLAGNAVRVEFHLDKSMPPAGGDARELGIVARSIGLESK